MKHSHKPRAVFMAFGTKGDVFPLAAIATAFAMDQKRYDVILVTHSAYMSLIPYLQEKNVKFYSVSSPPVLSVCDMNKYSELDGFSFDEKRKIFQDEHRRECFSIAERIFEDGTIVQSDIIVINFFALEGWNLAELFQIRCVVAAPYVVPYSVPVTFERKFKQEFPHLYHYFQEAPADKVNWKDILHWMWPLFTEEWGSWRHDCLSLSPIPFTDPVTGFPMWHLEEQSPLLLYGFSKEIVECPGLSSIGSMGFMQNPCAFLSVLTSLTENEEYRIILLTAGYEPLNDAIKTFACQMEDSTKIQANSFEDGIMLNERLFCFSGSIPYSWLFRKCDLAIHHGGSGSTAAALHAGIPQIACPFILDQFYWAERLHWLGVAPEPLHRSMLVPERDDLAAVSKAKEGLQKAIKFSLSPDVRIRAQQIKEKLSSEDGIQEALRVLKEKIISR